MLFWLKKFISYWMMPLPFAVLLLLAGTVLVFRRNEKVRRLGRGLLVAGVAVLTVFGNAFVSRALVRPLETRYAAVPDFASAAVPAALARCEYIVVLGGGNGLSPAMAPTHLLSSSALARVVEAVRLARAMPGARVIVSGPGEPDEPSHAAILAAAAQSLGIAPGRILRIEDARDTEEEMLAVKRLAGAGPVAVVTSAWHLPRAMALARSAGLDAFACPTDYRSHAQDKLSFDDFLWELGSLERSTFGVRERIGQLWIRLRGKAG